MLKKISSNSLTFAFFLSVSNKARVADTVVATESVVALGVDLTFGLHTGFVTFIDVNAVLMFFSCDTSTRFEALVTDTGITSGNVCAFRVGSADLGIFTLVDVLAGRAGSSFSTVSGTALTLVLNSEGRGNSGIPEKKKRSTCHSNRE